MQLRKSSTIAILICGLLVLLAYIVYAANIPVRTINVSGEVTKSYNNIDELKTDAEVIVEIDSNNVNSFKYKDVIFSLSNVEVLKTFKGNIKKGELLNILETGGVYNNADYIFENNKTLAKNDKAILFLKKYIGPVTEKEAYVVLGVYQGKFNYTSNGQLVASNEVKEGLKMIKRAEDLKLQQTEN